ncbi:MAG: protein-L-isoaspartate(D-aspartate) O-methyltransferase [Alkalispirochaetaceae bacterium]
MSGKELRHTLEAEGIRSSAVLGAIERVPRELFVPEELRDRAYVNAPLPIGEGQTISQPYTVAVMLELARVGPGKRVLEVGAGSGYAAACIAEAVGESGEIVGVEVRAHLADHARQNLRRAGYDRVRIVVGDGREGYEAGAPYDAIIVSAEATEIPEKLTDQLAEGGSLVVPVRSGSVAIMQRIVREGRELKRSEHGAFSFVPLVAPPE